jgi:aspartate/methionine/tyrosine aminotransferase
LRSIALTVWRRFRSYADGSFVLRSQEKAAKKKQQRKSSKEKAMYLLEQTGLASVRGEAFFHNGGGKNLVRFCFAKSEQELQDACKRLE